MKRRVMLFIVGAAVAGILSPAVLPGREAKKESKDLTVTLAVTGMT